ncbi:MAG: hypothetical protein C0596_14990 [Marinilabiliales bacterium]|nr:MAG: hypothetical protein C0596_14990 [Marinilabiliales bacterium]
MKLLLSLFLTIICISAFAQPFDETIITGNFPDAYKAKVADLDDNTYEDIVAVVVGGIAWFKNTNGSDFETIMITDSILVRDIDIVDFDFDTDMDMVGFNSTSGILFTLINDGSENFTYNVITDTLPDIKQITAVDTDNDNDIDIFFNIYDGGFYDVYLYEFDAGVYLPAVQVDRVDYSKDIYVFDYENDNDVDFLTKVNYTPFDTEEIGIMVNDGSNTFTEIVVYESTGDINITDAQFVDIDDNGIGDLVIADNTQNELYWLENAGSSRHNILASADASAVLVQDYDNDGVMDVAFKDDNTSNYSFYVLEGNNPGPSMTFTEVYSFELETTSTDLESIDVNNDNLPEWAYSAAGRDEVGYFINEDAFAFTNYRLSSYISVPESLRRVDLDLDGDLDIVAFASDETVEWFDAQTDGTYIQKEIISRIDNPYQLEVYDMNDDGFLDIITASVDDDDFAIWYNDGNQFFTEGLVTWSNTQLDNPSYFSIADLDNDYDMDFVVIAASTSSTRPKGIFWIENLGGGTFSSPIDIEDGINLMGEVVTFDFDYDGDIDIIVADGPYGATGLRTIRNNGGGSFTSTNTVSFKAETLRLGDIDSDGLMDFITRNDDNNDIVWFKNNGDFTFTENTITMSEARDVELEICDVGNDGITDIFFYTNYYGFTNSNNFTAGILINDGSESFAQTTYLSAETNLNSAIAVDIELDGDMDFFLAYDYADKISIFENLTTDLIDPVITTWPTASDITVGDALLSSSLSGGSASVPGTFSFVNPAYIPDAGIYTAQVAFIPTDPITYNSVIGSAQVTVNKLTPTVTTWPNASDIIYGQDLSASVLSGGSASVAGTFSFDNPLTTPPLGIFTAYVTFTPDNLGNYNTVSGTVDVEVLQATPTVTTWPTATAIIYGDELSVSILSGGAASVSGTFSFDAPTTTPDAGTYTADVTFTPDDNINYSSINGTVDVTVNKADPIVDTWPSASDITYGDELSISVLSGGNADVAGTFSFDAPTTTPDAGTYTADVTFTPTDNLNYNDISGTVNVTVNKANPIVDTWPSASDITYGDELSLSVLSGGNADVAGTFSFDTPTTTPDAGTYTADVTFTPTDNLNYNNISGTVDVTVNKADPIVDTWPTANDITYGDELSLSVLSGGNADVPGTFSFDAPTTTPDAGTYTADVTFTPTDNLNYNNISGTVDVTVNKADPVVDTWPSASDITYGDELSLSVLSGGNADVAGTFNFDAPTTTPNAGIYTADLTFIPTDNTNYNDINGTVDVTVNKADQTIEWTQTLDVYYGAIITLEAISTSGLTVEFMSDNTEVAVITGDQLEIVGYGTANIIAMQD